MALIHNISTVAHYEAKTLGRSWFFRLFLSGSLFILTIMNIGLFSPIGDENWMLISIPASVPLINLYLLNIGQAIVVIFLAADFLKRDKKVDTNEVLYTRSMSNFEYITGKTWGILRLFLILDLLILAIALTVNIISQKMSVDIVSYLVYMLLLTVPTVVFSLGLAFVLMSILKNQALTFLFLLGIAALDMFWLWYRAGSLFDYMAFGLPLYKSDIAGYSNLEYIVYQRLMFFFAGLALVMATILMFKRLPQSRSHTLAAAILLFAFSSLSVYFTYKTWDRFNQKKYTAETVIETNRRYENVPFTTITAAAIDITHSGDKIKATASLGIINLNSIPAEKYYFSLNPGLEVSDVTRNGVKLQTERDNHILVVISDRPLLQGEKDSIIVSYSGKIMEAFCYPDFMDNMKENPFRIAMVNVDKRQAFLSDNYLLLTPETHWYPTASLNYYPSNPARMKVDFTRYTVTARSDYGLMAVSQGRVNRQGEESVFVPDTPLTGLTLAMGNYVSDTLKAGETEFISWHYPGNDYYKKELPELKDTIAQVVKGFMNELETNFSTSYPFPTLSFVEVPVQFYSNPRMNTQTRAELQPSMVLIPEKLSTLENAGFSRRIKRMKRNNERNNQVVTDKELQLRVLNNFIRNSFISGTNFRFRDGVAANEPARYRLGPSFYYFVNNIYSEKYPILNAAFETHLQKINSPGRQQGQMMFGTITETDKANLILRHISFRNLLSLKPEADTVRAVLTVKGDYLFNLLRKNIGIDEFGDWFRKYLYNNRFSRTDIEKLNDELVDKFSFDLNSHLDNWYNGTEQPGFLITELKAKEIVVDDRSRYQVTFVASNPEKEGGLFNVSFRTGGAGGGGRAMMSGFDFAGPAGGGSMSISMQGRGMEASDIKGIIYLAPGEAKRIGFVLDNLPREMMVNTLFSKNLPCEISLSFPDLPKTKDRTDPFIGEERLDKIPQFTERGEIIVDNEDPGFRNDTVFPENKLRQLLGVKTRRGEVYGTINNFNPPTFWQPVIETTYFGKYIRSAIYTRKGTGDKSIVWKGLIDKPGYYDIYAYFPGNRNQVVFRGNNADQGESLFKDLHYIIYHDDGEEEITIDFENAESGWNKLGTYYLSPDTVKVSLSNKTEGNMVIGDAIRWVLQQ